MVRRMPFRAYGACAVLFATVGVLQVGYQWRVEHDTSLVIVGALEIVIASPG